MSFRNEVDPNFLIGCVSAVVAFAILVGGVCWYNSLPYPSAIDKCAHAGVVVQNSGFCMELSKQKQ